MRIHLSFYYVAVALTLLFPLSYLVAENRTFDGLGNNLQNDRWGAVEANFLRLTEPAYGSRSNIVGADLPEPRVISNQLFDQNELFPSVANLSGYVYAFGQFISHDLQQTRSGDTEQINMQIPADDLFFFEGEFPLTRSIFDPTTGRGRANPRQQVNFATAFLDASVVYGATEEFGRVLRGGPANPSAKLRTSNDINGDGENLLPRDAFGPNLEADFIAGDDRANDNVVLTAIHTVFMREHNRLVDELAQMHTDWTDEALYQRARKLVGAELQAITFNEWLPALIGTHAPSLKGTYDSEINPGIVNEFATVFLRLGHSMLTPDFKRVQDNGQVEEPVGVQNAFFNPSFLDTQAELELLLKGLSVETQETVDLHLVDPMRLAFLGAIDIQRARDHGLGSYNEMREAYGLEVAATFADITTDEAVQASLASVYDDVDSVEAFVGALAEDHLPGAQVGSLATAVFVEQFTRLRDGDRFWYSNDDSFNEEERVWIEATTLSDVIMRNTGLTTLQDNVFFARTEGDLDCSGDGMVTVADLACTNQADTTAEVLSALGILSGDLDGNGHVDFADFLTLSGSFGTAVDSYSAGDVDDSGLVDFADFLQLSGNFGQVATATRLAPEPVTGAYTLLSVVGIFVHFSLKRPRRRSLTAAPK